MTILRKTATAALALTMFGTMAQGASARPWGSRHNGYGAAAAVLGVLALGGLVLGAVLVLGGGDKKPVASNSPATGASTAPMTPSANETPGGTEPETPGGPVTPGGTVPKTPRKPRASGLKEITNLLPGDAVSVWHLRMDELARTPL